MRTVRVKWKVKVLAGILVSASTVCPAVAADFVNINSTDATAGNYDAASTGATGENAIAIGVNAQATGTYASNSIAIGTNANTENANSIVIGNGAHVDSGGNAAYGRENIAIGNNARAANLYTVSIGSSANAWGSEGVAIGHNSQATYQDTALGRGAQATGSWSTALGNSTTASGRGSVAVGNGATATGIDSFAGSYRSVASGTYSVAIGYNAQATSWTSTALGFWSTASNPWSVALGASSTTEAVVGTANATIKGITYGNFAGANPLGTVSVGSATGTTDISANEYPKLHQKTITNVAAGRITETSTDAINGSQLYAVASVLGDVVNNNVQVIDAQINGLKTDISRSGALSAALAALKPLQYDPMQRHQVMAGIGHYKDRQAVAIGFATHTDERTMLHIGAAYGGEKHMMFNAGATWQFGRSEEDKNRPTRYDDGPISSIYVLQDEVSALQEENMLIQAENDAIRDENRAIREENQEIRERLNEILARLG